MSEEDFKKLKDTIWITRISRIHSEKRLLEIENYCRFLNVYYSFFTIVFSLLAFFKKDEFLSLLAIIMSILLLVAILYLDSQKCYERARNFRKDYTSLYELELKLKHISYTENESILTIEKQYCDLIDSNSNHTTFDYYCALADSKEDFKERYFTGWIPLKYYWGIIWRHIMKVLFVILPMFFIICYFFGVNV